MPSYSYENFISVGMRSSWYPLFGQRNRSSGNFRLNHLGSPDTKDIYWTCPDDCSFDVMRDMKTVFDPIVFRDVTNGTSTSFPDADMRSALYIANPRQVETPFVIEASCRDTGWRCDNWMGTIDKRELISDLCIPGTHDSGATAYLSYAGRCQTLGIFDQLYKKGVRFLDIRCQVQDGKLRVCHAWIKEPLFLDDVLDQCVLFLRIRPSESIIMSIKKDYGDSDTDFEKVFLEKYFNAQVYRGFWYSREQIPDLGSVRGKIMLFRRFASSEKIGINAAPDLWKDNAEFEINTSDKTIAVQDVYSVKSAEEKFDHVYKCLTESSPEKWYINFASGVCKYLPSAATVSNYVNVELDKYMREHTFTGVLLMDYIDQNSKGDYLQVARGIISRNFEGR